MNIKGMMEILKEAREIWRLAGPHEKIKVLPDSDWQYIMEANDALVDQNNNLMCNFRLAYDCIEDMGAGKSRCPYCLEYEHCEDAKKDKPRGCKEWVLKFPEEDVKNECECSNPEEGRELYHGDET